MTRQYLLSDSIYVSSLIFFSTLDGRQIAVGTSPGEVVKQGDMRVVPGEGFPAFNDKDNRGRLIIVFTVRMPVSAASHPFPDHIYE